ncbi:unnamed protein product, partial [Cladocopium goreaui]
VPNGGYRVEGILVVHSFFLSGLSLVMFLGCTVEVFRRVQADGWGWTVCEQPGGRSAGPLYFWTYIFYVSKFYELLDTSLVMVKGSRPPHYMLHIFHHSAVPVLVWAWLQWQMSLQHIGCVCTVKADVETLTAQEPELFAGENGSLSFQASRVLLAKWVDEHQQIIADLLLPASKGVSGALAWCCHTGAQPGSDGTE